LATFFALTTIDNPFDPIDDYENWFAFDSANHYDCCQLLARFSKSNDEFSVPENISEDERAIDEIVRFDPTNKYKKVKYVNDKLVS
jgi:hypothetical protein